METSDVSKAAYLTYKGHRVTIIGPAPCRFVFAPEATKDATEYEAGVLVPAAVFADCLWRMKRLAAEKRGGPR
jgi:hypothetical protein